jgi:glutamine amidotransferase
VIAVIDYKAGNLTSVMKALHAVDAEAVVTSDPDVVMRADKLVLPGVGHFSATSFLEERGLKTAIDQRIRAGIPFLGICVGLQWLFEGSTESPQTRGLGAFSGCCERFGGELKVPHVGWNSLAIDDSKLMEGVPNNAFVYYTHSFRAPVVNGTVAVTEYGVPFTAAVERDNVMGVQFHPEKSGSVGLRILENFVRV